jgi:hypothetical protein
VPKSTSSSYSPSSAMAAPPKASALGAMGSLDGALLSAQTVTHAHRIFRREGGVENDTWRATCQHHEPAEGGEGEDRDPERGGSGHRPAQGQGTRSQFDRLHLGNGNASRRIAGCDIDGANMRGERSLEETKAGLNSSPPKSKRGRGTISLPPSVVSYCANIGASTSN